MGAQDGELASLKINVSFSVGKVELAVKQLQDLSPGVLLPLNTSDGDYIEVYANGVLIGAGELVSTGGKLAVRVTRLYSNE